MKCKFCGCTDTRACPGGCSWTRPEVCSQCADVAIAAYAPLDVRYTMLVPYRPRGLKLDKEIQEVEYQRSGKIGFIPSPGMLIDCGDGDLRKAEEVYVWPEERRIEVYLGTCDSDARTNKFMLEHGWVPA